MSTLALALLALGACDPGETPDPAPAEVAPPPPVPVVAPDPPTVKTYKVVGKMATSTIAITQHGESWTARVEGGVHTFNGPATALPAGCEVDATVRKKSTGLVFKTATGTKMTAKLSTSKLEVEEDGTFCGNRTYFGGTYELAVD